VHASVSARTSRLVTKVHAPRSIEIPSGVTHSDTSHPARIAERSPSGTVDQLQTEPSMAGHGEFAVAPPHVPMKQLGRAAMCHAAGFVVGEEAVRR